MTAPQLYELFYMGKTIQLYEKSFSSEAVQQLEN